MTSIFPWALGGPLALYLGLLVITLALHAVFVGYVLGGVGWTVVAAIRGTRSPIREAARDWLPFALGAAITAGVAPLLFVQLVYQERFYTANLLLFHRWMAVVPALIIGFYLLYLHKSEQVAGRAGQIAIAVAAALCFGFVAWSWTENHLLSQDRSAWRALYESGGMLYVSPAVGPRLLVWLTAALPIFAAGAAWQVRARAGADASGPSVRRLGIAALVGIAASAGAALWLYAVMSDDARFDLDQPMLAAWWLGLAVARAAEAVAWILVVRRPDGAAARRWLARASAAGFLAIVTGAMVREGARLHALEPLRERWLLSGGQLLFMIAAVVSIAAMIVLYKIVRRGLAEGPAARQP